MPLPYRDFWSGRYAWEVSHLHAHPRLRAAPTSHSLFWRGAPRYVCRAPPWDALCHRTRLAFTAYRLCRQQPSSVAASQPQHLHRHQPSSGSAPHAPCAFDVKLVDGPLHTSVEAAPFLSTWRSELFAVAVPTASSSSAMPRGGGTHAHGTNNHRRLKAGGARGQQLAIDEQWMRHQFIADVDGYGYSGASRLREICTHSKRIFICTHAPTHRERRIPVGSTRATRLQIVSAHETTMGFSLVSIGWWWWLVRCAYGV